MSFVVVLPEWLGDGGGTTGEEHQPFPGRQEHSGGVAGPGDLLHGHQCGWQGEPVLPGW